jgi:hypothetical protein
MVVFPYYKNLQNLYFPVIPVTVSTGKIEKYDTTALIDSGATVSIFRTDIANQLKIDIKKGEKISLGGVGGKIKGYVHELKAEIGNKFFKIPVVFSFEYSVSFNLLGRSGFFDQFRITFDEKKKLVELI